MQHKLNQEIIKSKFSLYIKQREILSKLDYSKKNCDSHNAVLQDLINDSPKYHPTDIFSFSSGSGTDFFKGTYFITSWERVWFVSNKNRILTNLTYSYFLK